MSTVTALDLAYDLSIVLSELIIPFLFLVVGLASICIQRRSRTAWVMVLIGLILLYTRTRNYLFTMSSSPDALIALDLWSPGIFVLILLWDVRSNRLKASDTQQSAAFQKPAEF